MNNLKVITTTSNEYATSFGFTEQEVFEALEQFGLSDNKEIVKKWYDGFVFGQESDIYNPWSIINFLDTGKFAPYWANTSSNSLVEKLIRKGSQDVKIIMEDLFSGTCSYELQITNKEVYIMFRNMIKGWFARASKTSYNNFIKALLQGDLDAMNEYMNDVAVQMFSSFDTGTHPSKKQQPERFYHGFVLGLLVDLRDRYLLTSNRESGFGRYDVILEPLESGLDAIILEFKVYKPKRESTLEDTVNNALAQIEEKGYATDLMARGISKQRIRCYGFAFEGSTVLIV